MTFNLMRERLNAFYEILVVIVVYLMVKTKMFYHFNVSIMYLTVTSMTDIIPE